MDEHDYDPVLDSRYNCDKCEDSGIDIDTREYCEHCQSGARRCNNDKFAEMLRGSPFLEAMWTMNQATMKSERAIAAAEMALLKHRIAGLERELAEVRKAQPVVLSNERIITAFEPHIDSDPTAPHDMPTYLVRQDELIAYTRAILAAKEQA